MADQEARRELVGAGIRVNAIGRGFIETNMTAIMLFMPEDAQQQLYAQIPMTRIGTTLRLANTSRFHASTIRPA